MTIGGITATTAALAASALLCGQAVIFQPAAMTVLPPGNGRGAIVDPRTPSAEDIDLTDRI